MAAKNTRRIAWLATICGGIGFLTIAFYWSQYLSVAILGEKLGNEPSVLRSFAFFQNSIPRQVGIWENAAKNWLIVSGKKAPVSDQLAVIGIDDASTSINSIDLEDFATEMDPAGSDYHALELMSKGWHWSREAHALILEKLIQAGAKVVVYDVVFQSESPNDARFAQALNANRDRVVVGSNFDKIQQSGGKQTYLLTVPSDTLIPQTTPIDDRVGFVNYNADPWDAQVRTATFRSTLEIYNGFPYEAGQEIFQSLAAVALNKAGLPDHIPDGLDQKSIHFANPNANQLQPLSAYQLFVPRYWKSNFRDGALLKNKIVVVGPYATIMHDEVSTPFGPLPGPHMHLQALNAAIQRAFITPIPLWAATGTIALAALLAFCITWFLREPVLQFLSLLGGSACFAGASWIAYNHFQVYPATVTPLLALNGGGIVSIVYQFVVEQLERARTRRTLERYVSRNLVSELLDNPGDYLEVKRRPVTVLFSDLRGFTSMTENADPHVLVVQLNEYLTEMVKCVFAYQGTLDKFIGDAVMAVWGNVKSHGNAQDAKMAVLSALDMRIALKKLNARWREVGLPEFRFGIGLNHGEVITGDIGSPEKSEFTVIGDPINLASRMEGLTKNYGTDILIGEDVAELVADQFVLQSIDRVRVKGKGEPTEVFAVHQSAEQPVSEELATYLESFATAMHLFRAGFFSQSRELFAKALLSNPEDPVAAVYIDRCDQFLENPPGPDWDGVFTMKTK